MDIVWMINIKLKLNVNLMVKHGPSNCYNDEINGFRKHDPDSNIPCSICDNNYFGDDCKTEKG